MAYLFRAYTRALNGRPYLITSLTSGVCYGVGDILAQTIEIKQEKKKTIDFKRVGIMSGFGLTIGGPLYCAWFQKIHHINKFFEYLVKWNYQRQLQSKLTNSFKNHIRTGKIEDLSMKNFIETNKEHFESLNNPIAFKSKTILAGQVYADQFIFSAIYPIIFMMSTGIAIDISNSMDDNRDNEKNEYSLDFIENSVKKNWQNIKNKYLTIYMTDCALWPLIQIGNFAFVSAIYQPIFVNFINIFWNSFLCYISQGH